MTATNLQLLIDELRRFLPDESGTLAALHTLERTSPTSGSGGIRSATLVIAASNASAASKAAADIVCSGTADQTVINSAIAALSLSNGAFIFFTEGDFNLTGRILCQKDHVRFWGAGKGATRFNAVSGFTDSEVLRFCRDDLVGSNLRPAEMIDVGYLTVYGAWLGTQSTSDGILFKAYRSDLHNVQVWGMNGIGVRVRGVTAAEHSAANDWSTYGTRVSSSKIHENGNGGVLFDLASGDSSIDNCEIFSNCGPGIDVPAVINEIADCYIWGNNDQSVAGGGKPGNGIRFTPGAGRTNVVGNKIEQNRGGIRFTGGGSIQINGNVFAANSCSFASSLVPSGWYILGSSNQTDDLSFDGSGGAPTGILVFGNIIDSRVYANDSSRYSVYVNSGTIIIISGNNVGAGLTGALAYNLGGGNVVTIDGNQGIVTAASGQATIASGTTSIVVNHGLSWWPNIADFTLTLNNGPTNAIGNFWIDSVNATSFTIHVAANPGASGATFGWSVRPNRFS